MNNARVFLIENPIENIIIAARIYDVNAKTLTVSIRRDAEKKNDEHNQILKVHEEKTLNNFIKSLLIHEIAFTYHIVFGAINNLKKAHEDVSFLMR